MSAVTLAEQADAMRAVADMADAFGHLPSADITISPYTPGQIDITLYDGLGTFEAWRSALGIVASDVDCRVLPTRVRLQAGGSFAGATVELVGYSAMLPGGGE